jgi:hypothetical protein
VLVHRGGPRSKALVRRFARLHLKQNTAALSTTNIAEQSCFVLRSKHTKRNVTFCEISMLGCLRNQHEDKSNRSRVRLACFLLVCRLESIDWCFARLPRRGDFLSMMEGAMSIALILFLLIILLFGFDSTEHARDLARTNRGLQQTISLLLGMSRAHRIQRKR